MELLFWAVVAIFVIYKLISLLGRDDFSDQETRIRGNKKGGCFAGGMNATCSATPIQAEVTSMLELSLDGNSKIALSNIRYNDSSFDLDKFVTCAKKAFSIIVEAFARSDKEALQHLLDDKLYNKFSAVIEERSISGKKLEQKVLEIKGITIKDIEISGNIAKISVDIVSKQTYVVRDTLGNILDGEDGKIIEVTDHWTFVRNIPVEQMWKLEHTK